MAISFDSKGRKKYARRAQHDNLPTPLTPPSRKKCAAARQERSCRATRTSAEYPAYIRHARPFPSSHHRHNASQHHGQDCRPRQAVLARSVECATRAAFSFSSSVKKRPPLATCPLPLPAHFQNNQPRLDLHVARAPAFHRRQDSRAWQCGTTWCAGTMDKGKTCMHASRQSLETTSLACSQTWPDVPCLPFGEIQGTCRDMSALRRDPTSMQNGERGAREQGETVHDVPRRRGAQPVAVAC